MSNQVVQEVNYYVAKWFNRRFPELDVTPREVAKIFGMFWQYAFKAAMHGYGIRPSSRRFALRVKTDIFTEEADNKVLFKSSKNPFWGFKFIFYPDSHGVHKRYDIEFVPDKKYGKQFNLLLETTDIPLKLLKDKYYLR